MLFALNNNDKRPEKEDGIMATKAKEINEEKTELMPWRPFGGMTRWQEEIERTFGDFLGSRLWPSWDGRRWLPMGLDISAPVVDLYDEKDEIVVKAELPGMAKDEIEIDISDHQLTLKGEKKKEEEIKEENYYRCERSYGSFTRVLDLPAAVQNDKVHASYKNGVLEIRLPKTEAAKKKEIKVKVE
jgi:HSP20 family protein